MERDRRRHQLAVGAAIVVTVTLAVAGARCVAPAADGGGVTASAATEATDGEPSGATVANQVADAAPVAEKNVGYGVVRTYEVSEPLVESSADLLRDYRDRGDCVLVRSGYLDLVGSVWSCTVQMPDAVEVCFVSEGADGRSTLRVLRMEGSEWRDLDVSTLPDVADS